MTIEPTIRSLIFAPSRDGERAQAAQASQAAAKQAPAVPEEVTLRGMTRHMLEMSLGSTIDLLV